jgi:putative endonuclease
MTTFYTYILKCADGTLYTGWTTDIQSRVAVHNRGEGAKYTRARLPVTLAACWEMPTKREAMQREWRIKRLRRREKEKLIAECIVESQ